MADLGNENKMQILHIAPDCKASAANPQSEPIVSRVNGPRNAANDNHVPAWRSVVKGLIVSAYCWGLLSVRTAQNAIDRSRSWEA